MIAYVLYNKATQNEGLASAFAKRLEDEQVDNELVDADSPRGIQLAEAYDVMDRPAVLLMKADGSPVQVWQGADGLPAPSEVAYMAHQ